MHFTREDMSIWQTVQSIYDETNNKYIEHQSFSNSIWGHHLKLYSIQTQLWPPNIWFRIAIDAINCMRRILCQLKFNSMHLRAGALQRLGLKTRWLYTSK